MLIARYFLPQVSPAPCTYGEIIHNNNSNRILEEEEKMTVGNGWRENKVNVLLATPEINRIEEREREREMAIYSNVAANNKKVVAGHVAIPDVRHRRDVWRKGTE